VGTLFRGLNIVVGAFHRPGEKRPTF